MRAVGPDDTGTPTRIPDEGRSPATPPPRNLPLELAADALTDWGFLAEPGQPGHSGPGYLLVAIRHPPTFVHFDPESVEFWISRAARGERVSLDRHSAMPFEAELAWGQIRIRDRLRVSNEYLTFGGAVTAGREDGTTVVAFVSPAPLLRRGGHSQGWDLSAQSVGAFFARLVAEAGRDRAFEVAAARADPVTRYAAFIADQIRRRRSLPGVGLDAADWRFQSAEAARLRRDDPHHWEAGQLLGAVLGS
ncbi:MAG: hypothetical protein LH650_05330 [Chloroflexi bacterium]|nr:hypothetical protein [Chloroflexota bacterium]